MIPMLGVPENLTYDGPDKPGLYLPNGDLWVPPAPKIVNAPVAEGNKIISPAPAVLNLSPEERAALMRRPGPLAERLRTHMSSPGPYDLVEIGGHKVKLPSIRGAAATAWAFTNGGRTSLLNGTFDLDTDAFKMALFLSTSNIGAASTTYAGVTNEHATANGYTSTGISITLTLAGTTTVTVDIATDPVWTAAGGSITARFAAIYEVSGNVLVYCTLDSAPADVTATDGNTLTVAAHASGVFTLA